MPALGCLSHKSLICRKRDGDHWGDDRSPFEKRGQRRRAGRHDRDLGRPHPARGRRHHARAAAGREDHRRPRQVGDPRARRLARALLPVRQSLHAAGRGGLQCGRPLRRRGRAQQGTARRDVQGLARERRHQRRRHRRAVLELRHARPRRRLPRRAARRRRGTADLDDRPAAARPRRSPDREDHVRRRGARTGRARARAQSRLHQGLVHPPGGRRSRGAGSDREGGRRRRARGGQASRGARDRAGGGESGVAGRRRLPGARRVRCAGGR